MIDRHFYSAAANSESDDDRDLHEEEVDPDPSAECALMRPPLEGDATQSSMTAESLASAVERGLTEGRLRWGAAFVLVLALHIGGAAYVLKSAREALESGSSPDAINVELTPIADESDKPDDVAGPRPVEATEPTNDKSQSDDPGAPAPDSPPPTETKRTQPQPEATVPPTPDTKAELQAQDKQEERQPEEKPPVKETPDAKDNKVEQQTAPSQAHDGSAAQLSGGRRPSQATKATWAGEINSHIVHNRRYPQEARSNGWQGTARVRVTLDGEGHVLKRELVKSTGKTALDGEAIALMERSDPFPKPPPGMPVPVVMTVPVNFSIR